MCAGQVFPEYQNVFSDVFGKTSKEILLQFSSPADLEEISADTLAELLAGLSRKKLGVEKAKELSRAASTSFGVTFCRDSFSFQLRMLIEQIKYIESQVKDTEAEIKAIMKTLSSPITTVPGIGETLGAVILGEIGDIGKFDHASKLVAFTGIDSIVYPPHLHSLFRIAIGLRPVLRPYPQVDTLGLGYTLPATGRVRDFHPLDCSHAGRTTKRLDGNFIRPFDNQDAYSLSSSKEKSFNSL